jgi:HK97 gp10 family phage protein
VAVKTQLAGFRETREALQDLSKTVQRNVGRRALRVPAEIIADATRALAPVSSRPDNPTPGSLRASVSVVNAKARSGAAVAVLVEDPAAVPNEYGTSKMAAQPFMRPAINANEARCIAAFGQAIKPEVERAAAKAAKKSKGAGT